MSGGAYGEWHAYGRETFARATVCGRVRRTIGAVSGANRREIRGSRTRKGDCPSAGQAAPS